MPDVLLSALPSTPASRVAGALKGLPPDGLAEVLATDLAALSALADPKHTPVTRALAKGAKGALDRTHPAFQADKTVFVGVPHLAHLLEQAGGAGQS
jgi:hypothetical protein